MEIGEYVMFMFEGRKLWEGTREIILDAGVKELIDFIYANKLMEAVKEKS
jgi:phospholipid/cholesterol/gamma-HCH transport system ATP-binding protein